MNTLTLDDFARAAAALSIPVRRIQAICRVEAPNGGFDSNGNLRMLFEGHQFSKFTDHRYDDTHPTISARDWKTARQFYSKGMTPDIRNAGENRRLQEAITLDRTAALKSASYGKFQLMGFNFAACGFPDVEAMYEAMQKGEGPQLDAFVNFVKQDRGGALLRAAQAGNAQGFAQLYNGDGYKDNAYDAKLLKEGF